MRFHVEKKIIFVQIFKAILSLSIELLIKYDVKVITICYFKDHSFKTQKINVKLRLAIFVTFDMHQKVLFMCINVKLEFSTL